jgi:RNA polymerase sigma-70 factor (ECF subfamily)
MIAAASQDDLSRKAAQLESALLERARTGDTAAFASLVRRHQASVRAFVGSFLRNADVVDDVAQDVFLAAYTDLPTFRAESAFSTWLLGIARFRVLRHLRSNARRSRLVDSLVDEAHLVTLEADDASPSRREHAMAALQACLDALPPNTGQIITNHYFHKRRLGEIAQELNRGEGALRMTLLRIRRALRACVERRLTEETT